MAVVEAFERPRAYRDVRVGELLTAAGLVQR